MARMKDKKKAKRTTLRIPGMKDVEGKRPLAPEGEHTVKVVSVEQREGQNAPYFAWEFEIADGKHAGAKVWNNTSLAPQALWNLRGTLEALGVEIPDDDMDIDVSDLIDKECVVVVEHETYEGKKQARVTDILPAGETEDDGDGDDEKPKASAAKRSKDRDEDEDDEDDAPKSRRSRRARRDADSEEDEPKAKKKDKKKSGVTSEEVNDMSQDELEDLIKEHELDVDLEDFPTLRKMKKAVLAALEEAGALED